MAKVMDNTRIRLIIAIPFLMVAIMGCQKPEEPVMFIPKEKISIILKDVHLAEASLQTFKSHERDSIARIYYEHIFRINGVEEKKYYESIEHYMKNPEDVVAIYKVTTELLKKDEPAKKEKVILE